MIPAGALFFQTESVPANAVFGGLVVRVRMQDMKIIGYFPEVMKRKESLPFR